MAAKFFFRESTIGQIIYHASGRKTLAYKEDREDRKENALTRTSSNETLVEGNPPPANNNKKSEKKDAEKAKGAKPKSDEKEKDPFLVGWDGDDDRENPQNWPMSYKIFVTVLMATLTVSVYIGASIVEGGTELFMTEYGLGTSPSALLVTLFVFGYGIGPMFLSPLSELPKLGRTYIYIVTLFLFCIFNLPIIFANSSKAGLAGIFICRFLTGFFGSPALATGGATLADMYSPATRAYAFAIYAIFAIGGPVLGPMLSGFSAPVLGWRWTIIELELLASFTFIVLLFTLPETSAETLLYRKAQRIRAKTGDDRYKAPCEKDETDPKELFKTAMSMPFVLSFTEPIILAMNLFCALIYAILYLFITSFQLVFGPIYGFNLGEVGLAFLGIFVGCVITVALFLFEIRYYLQPEFEKNDGNVVPEKRLRAAIVGGPMLVLAMFWFGWTSRASIHWIVPIIGTSFFGGGAFLLFQAILNYLPDAYPTYAASVLAGNDLFRSCIGGALPLVSVQFFNNVGVGPACSIIGALAVLMSFIPVILYYGGGKKLRIRSKYAMKFGDEE